MISTSDQTPIDEKFGDATVAPNGRVVLAPRYVGGVGLFSLAQEPVKW